MEEFVNVGFIIEEGRRRLLEVVDEYEVNDDCFENEHYAGSGESDEEEGVGEKVYFIIGMLSVMRI